MLERYINESIVLFVVVYFIDVYFIMSFQTVQDERTSLDRPTRSKVTEQRSAVPFPTQVSTGTVDGCSEYTGNESTRTP